MFKTYPHLLQQQKTTTVAASPSPSQLGPKLPSGITISRVEPEISIVDIQPPPMPKQIPPNLSVVNRGRGGGGNTNGGSGLVQRRPMMSPAAQAAMRVKAQLRTQHHQTPRHPGNGAQGFMNTTANRGGFINKRGRPFLNARWKGYVNLTWRQS